MSTCYEEVDDLKKIKKDYGEQMAHLCRSLFPTILEQKGLLYYVISSIIPKSKDFYYDLINEHKEYEFKEFIYSICDTKRTSVTPEDKTVKELLDEAGYELFECKNNDDIQQFKKYYAPGEELCTFKDFYRINDHHIFFIVKKNVEQIKRSDYKNPSREDEYSTSVLDLQFDKGNTQRVSIKSRYNHTVINPDATYGNNLDNFIPGLTDAFERDYGFNISNSNKTNFSLEEYVWARDGKYYKFNYERNNIHYCTNNIILYNGRVVDKFSDKGRYTFMDYFILDEQDKKFITHLTRDSFLDSLNNINKIEISNMDEYKEVKLYLDGDKTAIIKLDSRGRIIGYINESLEKVNDDFLGGSRFLSELSLPSLKNCGNGFLKRNKCLVNLDLPSLMYCGRNFLYFNNGLNQISLPSLKRCEDGFLFGNNGLEELYLPSLEWCGYQFMGYNKNLKILILPVLKECGFNFLNLNISLKSLILPSLEKCGNKFLNANEDLTELDLPKLKECNDNFLSFNYALIKINLPELKKCCDNFLQNAIPKVLDLPNLEECGKYFLGLNTTLEELNAPKLHSAGINFLGGSIKRNLRRVDVSSLRETDKGLYDVIMSNVDANNQYYEKVNNSEQCDDLKSTKSLVLKRTKK